VGTIETRLKQMGLELPETHPYPSPNRTSAVRAGNVLYLSGHGTGRQKMPLGIRPFGKVGHEVSEQEAYLCAKLVALCMMASIKKAVGDLDRVKRVIRLYGMVNCSPDFDRHMAVIDGASDLFYELWGPEYGQHARAAVGIAGLPRGAVLEIMGEFELYPAGFDIAAGAPAPQPVVEKAASKGTNKVATKDVIKVARKAAKPSAKRVVKKKR
jgi:enamine deaminase RidA (YjgF/YER057c/UK114 family)